MKKYSFLFLFSIALSVLHAQSSQSNSPQGSASILVRHDTTTLKAEDCEWIIKSLVKNDPSLTQELGKPLSLFLLGAIEKGKIKAFDVISNKPIPANKILTWNLPADSVMSFDGAGNSKIVAMKRQHSSDKIDEVRIYHDWYLDMASGKLQSVIKWIELREQVYTSSGLFIGYGALCRIYY